MKNKDILQAIADEFPERFRYVWNELHVLETPTQESFPSIYTYRKNTDTMYDFHWIDRFKSGKIKLHSADRNLIFNPEMHSIKSCRMTSTLDGYEDIREKALIIYDMWIETRSKLLKDERISKIRNM